MAEESRDPRRRFGRNRNQGAPRDRIPKLPDKVPELKPGTCHICQKPIFDMSTALADRESPEPVHFDCAVQRITDMETFAPGEKLLYLGRGAFAVVTYQPGSQTLFTINRKIQWEKEGSKFDWRKSISQRLGL